MPLTDNGRNHIAQSLVGEATTQFNNANARIGVGSGNTAFQSWHDDLQGASKFRKAMDTGYPTRTANAMIFRATFGTEDANFAWEEWGVFNAGSGGTMLNRAIEVLGTKPSNQSWQFTVTLTVNNP